MAHLSLPPGPFPPGREVVPLELSLETWGILEYGWVPGGWVFSLPSSPCPTVWSQVPEGPLCPPAPGPCRLTSWVLQGWAHRSEGREGAHTHRSRTCRGWMPLVMRSDTMRTWALCFGSRGRSRGVGRVSSRYSMMASCPEGSSETE